MPSLIGIMRPGRFFLGVVFVILPVLEKRWKMILLLVLCMEYLCIYILYRVQFKRMIP